MLYSVPVDNTNIVFQIKQKDLFEDFENFFNEMYKSFNIIDKKGFRKEVEEYIFSLKKENLNLESNSDIFFSIIEKYMEHK